MARKTVRVVIGAALLAVAAVAGAQQGYPNRPIKLIVPWPPGGGVDTAARILSQPLAERLGQPIVVDNKPGVAGNLGTAAGAKEAPDGYTLIMGSLSPNSVNPHLYSKLGFDPIKDFEYVALAYIVPSFLVVPGELARELGEGPGGDREGEPGQAQLRIRRRGIVAAPLQRDVQHRRRESRPCTFRTRARRPRRTGSSPARSITWWIRRRRCRSSRRAG